MSRPKIALMIPSYKFQSLACRNSVHAAVEKAEQAGVQVISPPVFKGGCLPHVARNQMIAELLVAGHSYSHILFIDDDMRLEPDTITKLLSHKCDIVGGIYVKRSDPPLPVAWVEGLKAGEFKQLTHWGQRLTRVAGMGAGCLLVSKRVIERLTEFWIDCRYEALVYGDIPNTLSLARREAYEINKEAFWFEFLPSLDGSTQLGEDLSFCLKARMAGFECWLDTECCPGHEGAYVFAKQDYEFWRDSLAKGAK